MERWAIAEARLDWHLIKQHGIDECVQMPNLSYNPRLRIGAKLWCNDRQHGLLKLLYTACKERGPCSERDVTCVPVTAGHIFMMPQTGEVSKHFHPLCWQWFIAQVGKPTDIQSSGLATVARAPCAANSPTGSGKTLAASFTAIDKLMSGAWPTGGLRVVYLSPLKALGTDVRNLTGPLQALASAFVDAGERAPPSESQPGVATPIVVNVHGNYATHRKSW